LSVILPSDTTLVGAQLDVIAAAWFPRELRTRLRRMPILTMQTPEGVWSYPGASPSEPAASRLVRGGWMDLFVAHQIVFPLAVGRVTIPPATVEYAVPVNFSFFSREERYSLKSDSVLVSVLPLPVAGRIARGGRGWPWGRARSRRPRALSRRSIARHARRGRRRWPRGSCRGAGWWCSSVRRSGRGCGGGGRRRNLPWTRTPSPMPPRS